MKLHEHALRVWAALDNGDFAPPEDIAEDIDQLVHSAMEMAAIQHGSRHALVEEYDTDPAHASDDVMDLTMAEYVLAYEWLDQ